ncbi:MULE transposase domain [Popillia japonica]|uniref:MULE transposase domain n=1 Tax=Popillia japonica TaxID=7064 RepID=A0AAW1MPX9_POPJA
MSSVCRTRSNEYLSSLGDLWHFYAIEFVRIDLGSKFKRSARVTTVGDEIVKVGKDHNHVGDAVQVEAAKIYDSIRTSVKTTNDTPQNIISEVTLGCSQAAAPKPPRIDTMKRSIRRIRQQQMSEDAPVPLVYALLPNRTKEIYEHLLRQLKILQPVLSPRTIAVDFEKPMITALRNEFPYARLRGCFFHFTQCILRVISSKGLKQRYETDVEFALKLRMLPAVAFSKGLKQRYETDVEFALKLRMLPAVAFVPTESVVVVFKTHCENEIFPPEAQEVVDYFEDT